MSEIIKSILDHCATLGATVVSETVDAGYLTSCSFGTPWTGYPINRNGSVPVVGGFTRHTVRFSEPVLLADLCAALGVRTDWAWTIRLGQRVSRTIQTFHLWERPELIESLGEHGDGLCIMREAKDERVWWERRSGYHWTLTADGLRDGMFG